MFEPTLPMTPEALPQQRLVAVRELPPRPKDFAFQHEGRPRPKSLERASYPRDARFLCQVEWAWSPMHNVAHSYYVSTRRDYWLLWVRWFDDDAWPGSWRWWFEGWARRHQGVDERTAAFHLLADRWCFERDDTDRDRYHWINQEGEFSTADLSAIARVVWPEEVSDDGSRGNHS